VTGRLAELLGGFRPRVLVTLGSGLGALADEIRDPIVVSFADAGLPGPTVPGHSGRFVAGELRGVPVLAQQGRVHLYEGVGVDTIVAAVRAAAFIGVGTFVVTNAAGGLNPDFSPGDLMLITDHLNLTGANPLIGLAEPHFLDLKDAYDPALRALAHEAAGAVDEGLVEGVYGGLTGPAYETPAEVRMLRTLGCDGVGMSTVLEVIAARDLGLRVCGFSLITNVHRPGGTPTSHREVVQAGLSGGPRLAKVVGELISRFGTSGTD
jgi:purine-nucleoside phosphorylase